MSEMIERVARALYDRQAKLNGSEHSWETVAMMSKNIADEFRADARAAIEAIREPTEAMIETGNDEFCQTMDVAVSVWQRMIDSALDTPSQITPNQAGS